MPHGRLSKLGMLSLSSTQRLSSPTTSDLAMSLTDVHSSCNMLSSNGNIPSSADNLLVHSTAADNPSSPKLPSNTVPPLSDNPVESKAKNAAVSPTVSLDNMPSNDLNAVSAPSRPSNANSKTTGKDTDINSSFQEDLVKHFERRLSDFGPRCGYPYLQRIDQQKEAAELPSADSNTLGSGHAFQSEESLTRGRGFRKKRRDKWWKYAVATAANQKRLREEEEAANGSRNSVVVSGEGDGDSARRETLEESVGTEISQRPEDDDADDRLNDKMLYSKAL